jgi:hypothetical protein
MNNHPNTQERSLNANDSTNLPQHKSSLLANYPWLLLVLVGILLMAIAAMAINSLTDTGSKEKDFTKQTTIVDQKATQSKSNSSSGWLPTILLLMVAGTSAVAIYKWRRHLPIIATKRRLTRRQQRKQALQEDKTATPVATTPEMTLENTALNSELETLLEVLLEDQVVEPVMDITPTITVLPPEQAQSNNLDGQSLAEMMDIRQHLSLATILQDFKRPD